MVGSANDSDRVHRSHQTWFHFVKSPRYFAAVDEIREPQLNTGGGRGNYDTSASAAMRGTGMPKHSSLAMTNGNPLGKLPGSVWTIPYDTDLPEGDSPPMHNLGTAQIIQGNALNLPLPDASVDLICTSPPYFGLRSYQDSCQTCGGVDQSGPKMSGPSANSTLTGSKANRSGTDRDGQTPDPACTDCGGTGKGHYDGQIGSEATPAEFLDALLAATREMVRVLKPSGSIFVNLGDKYSTGNSGDSGMAKLGEQYRGGGHTQAKAKTRTPAVAGMRPKSLLGLPWRYAIACIDQLGLILRAEIIWSKPNGLPESVTDRVRRSHEQWFWFQSSSAVMEASAQSLPVCSICGRPIDTLPSGVSGAHELNTSVVDIDLANQVGAHERMQPQRTSSPSLESEVSPNGSTVPLAIPLDTVVGEDASNLIDDGLVSVENVDTQVGASGASVRESNTALSIEDSSEPSQVCRCSHPLILSHSRLLHLTKNPRYYANMGDKLPSSVWTVPTQPLVVPHELGIDHFAAFPMELPRRIIERWCPPGGVCVDVFGGTGTTALVAKALGRIGITIDLSSDYCRLAEWRCNDPRELAAALQVEKPEVVHPDQLDLFSEAHDG